MSFRGWVVLGLWVVATATATGLVWAATSTVAAELTDRPPPLVDHRDVVGALASGSAGAKTAPGVTSAARKATPTTVGGGAPSPSSSGPGGGSPAGGTAAGGGPVAITPAPATTVAPSTLTTAASPPTTTTVPARSASSSTFSGPGGGVTVACNNPYLIALVSTAPAAGYTPIVVNAGPYYVEVHFTRNGAEQAMWAFCFGHPILAYSGPSPPGSVLAPG